ncbi:uncharacterized protein LOC130814891 [Amaranthus tricolor]|uniref:uncharacterized protein LOC130814891 n=1 Tax=Amaranthus tricolor TaxID=29722 RepID=UPI002584BE49|nr:uncharacterized protein LOC130814891 [Amaranthus tricolor]
MKWSVSEKNMNKLGEKEQKISSNCFECRQKVGNINNRRLLVIINVLGSVGPLRIVVNEDDLVERVIDSALKLYSKEHRLPILVSDPTKFLLYCTNVSSDALSPLDEIGSCGGRNFMLCKKPEQQPNMTEGRSEIFSHKRSGKWKIWLNKSLSLKISSH